MADFNMPNEIWCKIFSYLPLASKKNATATSKLWFMLIREDPKLSGYISISWYNMETALEKLQWNWNNWPALKTLELKSHSLTFVEDSRVAIQSAIEKLSLKDCPPSLEAVLFDVDLTCARMSHARRCNCPHKCIATHTQNLITIQTYGQSILKYQPYTDQIFGLGQELDSIQKWNLYESNMKALKRLKSMGYRGPVGPLERILANLEATSVPSNDLVLLIQKIRLIWDGSRLEQLQMGYVFGNGYHLNQELVQYMELEEFLEEFDLR